MSGRRLAQAALAAVVALLFAAPGASAAPKPFVYVVVIDGLDGDRVDSGKAPFISSLLAGAEDANATYFQESRSVLPAETNPNHTAMMSGAYPGQSGIAANAFALYAPLANEDTCQATGPFDPATLPTETSGESLTCPKAQFTFEAIKRQTSGPRPTTAAIMGKPKLGKIFAGRNVNPARLDVDHLWAPCDSSPDDDEYCDPDAPTQPATGYAIDDATVMDEVVRTVEEKVTSRGKLRRPKLTFVNLPQVDSAGHALTPSLPAYDVAIAQADMQVERLVDTLANEGIWERSVLIVLSDHSMDTTPQKLDMTAEFANAGIGEDEFLAVDNGGADLIYLANRRSPDRHALLKEMRDVATGVSGVDEVLYRKPNPEDSGKQHALDHVHPGWHSAGRRSGDLFITAQEGYAFSEGGIASNPLLGNHGGSFTRDNFFAVIGGGDLVRQRTLADDAAPNFDDTLLNPRQAENTDVAPTVMRLFGLRPPGDSDGRFLRQAFDASLLPGRR